MSDSYDIDGVKVTPTGGGWYELTHPKLETPVKEQGKENADARAAELAKGYADLDSSMEGQNPVDLAAAAALLKAAGSESDEMAKLRKELEEERAAREKAEQQLADAPMRTVVTDGAPVVPATIHAPSEYTGILDDKRKAALKDLGIETTDIILEENEHIPPTGLFVGHNGRGYMISPGERVTVPNFLLGVLDDAIMSAPITDPKSMKVLGYRERSRYPYRKV